MVEHWIKLHRKMLEWEWFNDSTTLKLFINMLFKANYKPYKRMGKTYPAGSFICLRESLEGCGLTPKQVRHSLEKLKGTGEITTKTLGHATLFTITNWSKYQVTDGPNRNDTQNADFQHDTFKAPYDDGQTDGHSDGHSDGQTEDSENRGWPNKNHQQDTQLQHDTRDTNAIHGQRDGQRDGHSDGQTPYNINIHNIDINKEEKKEASLNAHTRTREDSDIPKTPYNPSQGFGAPPIIPYPTTTKEVIDAATMQGIPMTTEDAQDFLDRSEALGWMINNQPIRDWRKTLRSWQNKGNAYRRTHNNGNRQQQRFDTKHIPRADEYGEGDAF